MIGPVRLIEIKIVGLQSLQTVIDGSHDLMTIEGRMAVPNGRHEPSVSRAGDLGGQNHGITRFRFEPPADDFFGDSKFLGRRRNRIHFGRVEEVDSRIVRPIHDLKRQCFIALFAECHRSHANIGDRNATLTQTPSLHDVALKQKEYLGTA